MESKSAETSSVFELFCPGTSQYVLALKVSLCSFPLNASTADSASETLAEALHNHNYLTRTEIADVLKEKGIISKGQRLGHIVVHAELDGLICSGPRRGKQFTYGLLKERAPHAKKIDRETALQRLALNYFQGHGPAQVKDFAWWSGLTMKDAESAVDALSGKLHKETFNAKTYWLVPGQNSSKTDDVSALLLSIYDEFTIAYTDRSDMSKTNDIERMISMGNALTSVLVIDGLVSGTWKRSLKSKTVEVVVSPFRTLSKEEKSSINQQVTRLGDFLNKSASWTLKT